MTDTPLTDQQLDEIEARVIRATVCPEAATNGRQDSQHTWTGGSFTHSNCALCGFARPRGDRAEETALLLAEVRRLRGSQAALVSLADRWQQMADHGDTAIGTFDGPAAVTLDAEVGERGRVYRKAAADVRDVLINGRIPDDLMTATERAAAAGVAGGPR